MVDVEEMKKTAARDACKEICSGMVVGLGSGTTVKYAIERMGKLVRNGINFKGIPSSNASAELALKNSIPLTNLEATSLIDLTIDGADEIDPELNLLKGEGGCLTREKIVASNSRRVIIIADESKLVNRLCEKVDLPVEVIPFGWNTTLKKIEERFDAKVILKKEKGKPLVTDNHNYILSCKFKNEINPKEYELSLNSIPGVVENGLFLSLADEARVGTKKGKVKVYSKQPHRAQDKKNQK
jgi:ribose 5-phosphate isomerase A